MRFDVYAITNGTTPYIVDVQADFLSHLASRVVIPILPAAQLAERITGLHPMVEINGKQYVLITHQLTSILKRHLKRPLMSLASYRDDITRALDILLTGF